MEAQDNDFLASRRDTRMMYLSIWSRYRGQKQVLDIIAQVDAALHNKRLALDTGRMVVCKVRRKRSTLDADGLTYMGSVTLEIVTQH